MAIKYLDLFCGIGGFHQGIERYGEENNIETQCIFAADNNIAAANVYEDTYGMYAYYDMQSEETHMEIARRIQENVNVNEEDILMLVGGFPCQAFSKAGKQEGFSDTTKGTLFYEIIRIINNHRPALLLLENVRNLLSHNNGDTKKTILDSLDEHGYFVDIQIISPNHIGQIPALRERVFIMCYDKNRFDENLIRRYRDIYGARVNQTTTIYNKKGNLKGEYFGRFDINTELEDERVEIIEMWENFYKSIKRNGGTMISPIWTEYFNEDNISKAEPDWKIKLIEKNKKFYYDNKKVINRWRREYSYLLKNLCKSYTKFEWNAGDAIDSIWEGIIQFRPSGVRVKKPDFIPTLVAINQTPILGKERRYLNYKEMAKLYGFREIEFERTAEKDRYKQLGNTVSVDVVNHIIDFMMNNVGGEYNE